MHVKSALSAAVVLLAGAVTLTACQGSATASPPTKPGASSTATPTPTPTRPAASVSASASVSAPVGSTPSAHPKPKPTAPAAKPTAAKPTPGSGTRGGGTASGGGNATSDSYAWKHPCANAQLSIRVVTRSSAPTQRVIEVRNTGAASCGLTYYPVVDLYNGESATGTPNVVPLVPDGLGGAPYTPVYAGRTQYAVLDLDPSGATTGTVEGVDRMNLRASADLPSRDTRILRLGDGVHVLKPKLGLYRDNVADAVDSMHSADMEP